MPCAFLHRYVAIGISRLFFRSLQVQEFGGGLFRHVDFLVLSNLVVLCLDMARWLVDRCEPREARPAQTGDGLYDYDLYSPRTAQLRETFLN